MRYSQTCEIKTQKISLVAYQAGQVSWYLLDNGMFLSFLHVFYSFVGENLQPVGNFSKKNCNRDLRYLPKRVTSTYMLCVHPSISLSRSSHSLFRKVHTKSKY